MYANIPVFFCYLYYCIRSGSISFFKTANPAVSMGGAFGVSKFDMLKDVPEAFMPKMFLMHEGESIDALIHKISVDRMQYPVILKPDIGERGFMVQKIDSESQLCALVTSLPCDMIVQEFIDLPCEYTLSFNSMPGNPDSFTITSICQKSFLHVKGDGKHTARELMNRVPRYFLQIDRFEKQKATWLDQIIPLNESIYPEPIGNHNRGTIFLDARHLITDTLIKNYKALCLSLNGIYIGRFDLKASTESDFINTRVKIMELNGVLGEPVHMYDPGYTWYRAYRDIFTQWKTIFTISRINKNIKTASPGLLDQIKIVYNYFIYKKDMKVRVNEKRL